MERGWPSRPGSSGRWNTLAEANRRGQSAIRPAALLLGMVEVEEALSNLLLRDLGVSPADVRAAILRAAS